MRKAASSSRWRGIFEALGFGQRPKGKNIRQVKRHTLRLEPLEDRHLLSVLYWDPQQSRGSNLGGPGTWAGGGSALWYSPTTNSDVAWNSANGDTAVFQGTAGTVTVDSAGVSAGGIEFDTSGYSLAGAAITLTSNNNSGSLAGEIRGNSAADAIAAPLAGSVGATKTGTGTLTLTGANTYSLQTNVQNGTLAVAGGDNRLPVGTIVNLGTATTTGVLQLGDANDGASNQTVAWISSTGLNGAVVGGAADVSTLTVRYNRSGGTRDSYPGYLGGSGTQYQNNLALAMAGTNTLQLSAANTYSGGTFLDSGTVRDGTIDDTTVFGNPNSPIVLAGGSLTGYATIDNPIEAQAGTTSYVVAAQDLNGHGGPSTTLDGPISGSGTVDFESSSLSGNDIFLGGNNSGFSGTFRLSYGALVHLTEQSAGSSGATWELDDWSQLSADLLSNPSGQPIELGALSGSAPDPVLTNAGIPVTFDVGGNDQSTEFDGTIADGAGTVALTKAGTGTLTLAGNDTYSGGTAVNLGQLNVTGSVANSSVTVASDGTLSGTGWTGNVTADGMVSPGIGGVGALHTGNVTFSTGSQYSVRLTDTAYGQLDADGTVTLSGATLQLTSTRHDIAGDMLPLIESNGTGSTKFLGLSEETPVIVNSVTYLITYCYNVQAGETGTGDDVALLNTDLPAPANLTATAASDAEIDLNWSPGGITQTGYEIDRMTAATPWTAIATVAGNVTSYADTGLGEGTTNNYRIRATLSIYQSDSSNVAYGLTDPVAPSGLAVTFADGGQASLTWQDHSSLETGYSIEELANGQWQQLETVGPGAGAMNATVAGTFNGATSYSLRVRAYEGDFNGNPVYSLPSADTESTPGWPTAPSALEATPVSDTEIDLAWTPNATNADHYEVAWSTDGATWSLPVTLGSDASGYPDTAVTSEATLRYYKVWATNSAGDSAPTNVASATSLPAAPTDFAATIISGGEVDLSWVGNSSLATDYSIQQWIDGDWQEVLETGPGTGSMAATADGPFQPGGSYQFRVVADVETDTYEGSSTPSSVATVAALDWPYAPTSVTTTVVSNAEVDLSWTDDDTSQTGYLVERSTDGTTWSTITSINDPSVKTYQNTGLTDGTLYGYRVQATNTVGGSGYAMNAAATLPTAPTNLQSTTVSGTEIHLSWTAAPYATGYTISMQEEGSDDWQVIGSVPANQTTFAATGLAPGGTYYAFCVAPTNSTAQSAVAYLDPNTLNNAPSVSAQASASTVTGKSVTLTATGSDDGGEANLTYSWSLADGPGWGFGYFSANNSNAAKTTTVTFYGAGDFTFRVVATDARGASRTATVEVTVEQTRTSIAVSPGDVAVLDGTGHWFSAVVLDQFGDPSDYPQFSWSVSGCGDGTISRFGYLTAPSSGDYSGTVTASWGGLSGTANVATRDFPKETVEMATLDGAQPALFPDDDSPAETAWESGDYWHGEVQLAPEHYWLTVECNLPPNTVANFAYCIHVEGGPESAWMSTAIYSRAAAGTYSSATIPIDDATAPVTIRFTDMDPGGHSYSLCKWGLALLSLTVADQNDPADNSVTAIGSGTTSDLYVAENMATQTGTVKISTALVAPGFSAYPGYGGLVHVLIVGANRGLVAGGNLTDDTLSEVISLPATPLAHDYTITVSTDTGDQRVVNVHIVTPWTAVGTWTTGQPAMVQANVDGASLAVLAQDITGYAANTDELPNIAIHRDDRIDVTPLLSELESRIRLNVVAAATSAKNATFGNARACISFHESQIDNVFRPGATGGPICDCYAMVELELARGVIDTLDERDPGVDAGVQSEFDSMKLVPGCFQAGWYLTTAQGAWEVGDWVQFSNYNYRERLEKDRTWMWGQEQTIMTDDNSFYGWGGGTNTAAGWRGRLCTEYNAGLCWNPTAFGQLPQPVDFNPITIAQVPQPVDIGFVNVPKLALEIFNLRTKQGGYS
jgi:autotransporter-associated beta strand protein